MSSTETVNTAHGQNGQLIAEVEGPSELPTPLLSQENSDVFLHSAVYLDGADAYLGPVNGGVVAANVLKVGTIVDGGTF